MSRDPKLFKFDSKEDLIMYMSLVLELSIRHLDRHKRYLDEFSKIIKSNKPIDYKQYKAVEDKLYSPQNYLLNLFADRSKNSASYFRIRKVMLDKAEEFHINYVEHEQKDLEIMNDLYKRRNYEHHFTDAKMMEWGNYRKKQLEEHPEFQWPSEKIEINYNQNIKKEDAMLNYKLAQHLQKGFERLLELLKKDYSLMLGKRVEVVTRVLPFSIPKHNLYISANGQYRHLGKKKD
ncbi:hypothetical protein [Paenibacillus durus]|uniref:HEPN AbiU2-like domain-containing protein n=1 Tax=Paenibacillus durus ATCC 35681 TaxID=1333534 RepID=A0A0F7FCQ0_PAEDU|nr:hypothetical protein [Paenibacillus durus]AKG36184.1 hypothetical protein VK70_17795 [Paenibacillus durus ATCC 35681]